MDGHPNSTIITNMTIESNCVVLEVLQEKLISDGKIPMTTVIVDASGTKLAVDAWMDMSQRAKQLSPGDRVSIKFSLTSRPNNRDKSVWFSKLNLLKIKLNQDEYTDRSHRKEAPGTDRT